MARRTQGNTLLVVFFYKGYYKDTNGQPDEEGHRVRSQRALSAGISVPVAFGCATPMGHGFVQPGNSLSPFLRKFHHIGILIKSLALGDWLNR